MSSDEVERALSFLDSGTTALEAGRLGEAHENLGVANAAFANLVEPGQAELESDLADSWYNLGIAYENKGSLAAAAQVHQRALAIRERLVQGGRTELASDVADSWNNLGNVYKDQGVLAPALQAHQRALAIRERLVQGGRTELESAVADSWNNLGIVYKSQGVLVAALQAHHRALAIRERLVQGGRTELESAVADSWNNLGIVYENQGVLAAAAQAHQRALAIRERLVQAGRTELEPAVAGSWNNLGNVYEDQGVLAPALQAHQRALAIRERLVQGGRSELESAVADSWNNLGIVYKSQGVLVAALQAHHRALAIRERLVQGGRTELESSVADSWNNLGIVYKDQGVLAAALQAHQRALAIRERLVQGGRTELEPAVANSWNNLGIVYKSQGVLVAALQAHHRALAIRERLVQGGRTELEPAVADSWNNLGIVYENQGVLAAAAEAYAHSAALLTRCVAERGLWQHERRLADALLAVTGVRTQQGAFATAEDYLWHAVDLVPHLPSVLQAAVRYYGQWLAADDAALATGGLPRDEVWEGYGAILARLAPHHSYGAGARIALAQHRHLLGHQAEARGVFEQAVGDYGADTPGVYAHFARFLLATGDHAAAWTTCEQGWRSFAGRLEAAGNDPSPLPLDQVAKLVEGLLVLIDSGLAATSGSAELREHPERRTKQFLELSAALKPVQVWTPRLAASVRALVADAEQAIAQNAVSALSESERRRILGEQLLQSACGDRWPSVQSRIATLAQDDVDGEAKLRRIAEMEKDLLETLEIQQAEPQWRRQLSALLGADARRVLGSRVFDHLLIALAAPAALEKVGAPAEAAAAIALHQLGAAVEAALEGTVFEPYRAALRDGAAERIKDVGYLAPYFDDGDASALRLGTMTIPWGRLGAHWREPRPAIAALAQWLVGDAGPFDPERVKDPMLYRLPAGEGDLLDRIAALRNRGAHGTGAPAKPEDVVQLERLVLGAWREGDTVERGFLPRLFGATRRMTTS